MKAKLIHSWEAVAVNLSGFPLFTAIEDNHSGSYRMGQKRGQNTSPFRAWKIVQYAFHENSNHLIRNVIPFLQTNCERNGDIDHVG